MTRTELLAQRAEYEQAHADTLADIASHMRQVLLPLADRLATATATHTARVAIIDQQLSELDPS